MKYSIHVIDANIGMLDRVLIKQMRKLTLHPGSGLNNELDNFAKMIKEGKEIDAFFVLAKKDGDGKLIAWALVSDETSAPAVWGIDKNTGDACLKPFQKGWGSLFEVFVHPEYRLQGIGTQLLRVAGKFAHGQVFVVPWDVRSHSFYKKQIESKKVIDLNDKVTSSPQTEG